MLSWEDNTIGTEKNALLKQLVFENAGSWKVTSSTDFTPFPMWGETTPLQIKNETKTISGINLLRAIARVDIVLGEEAQKNFKLTDVYIYNTKTRGYVVPSPENIDATGKATKAQVPPATPTLPHNDYDPVKPNDKALKYEITTPTAFERSIYLMEAAAVASEQERNKATCLVVGGQYAEGETTWYRVDLFEESKDASGNVTEQKYKDWLRNHQYRFNIIDVKGPGFPDPETAFKEKTINMLATVKEWDDGQVGDIFFDGQHYLSINPGNELLLSKEPVKQLVKIKTDVLDGFKITKITENEEGTTNVSDKHWFTIDQALNTALGKNEEEVSLEIEAEENTTGAPRTSYIHLEAGRLRVKIKVTQSNIALNVFQFISMDNASGKGLYIPLEGGKITATANANIEWTLKARRGDKTDTATFTPSGIGGEIEKGTLGVEILPLSRYWKDDQEMLTDIDVWIEYQIGDRTVKVQETVYYQVPYDMKVVEENTPIPTTINKYGDFIELELKGFFPDLPFRVVDKEGNVVSDVVIARATGDIVNNDNFSTRIKFLIYANYSGKERKLHIEYERPLKEGPKDKEWKKIAEGITQKYNGLTLPIDGYKATRGVLGIGAKTGKLRLDGSYGLFGGTATYMDKDGKEQPEDVYVVCFQWGSLFALKAPLLNAEKDEILISENQSSTITLKELIAWIPPGYTGSIDLEQGGYLDLPFQKELHLPATDDLQQGLGDPCRLAQDEHASDYKTPTYGAHRMPWGVGEGNHEAFNASGNPKLLEETEDREGKGYYFLNNTYYKEVDRQKIPGYALIYTLEAKIDEETGDESGFNVIYKADYIGRNPRREYMVYWTSTTNHFMPAYDEAYIFKSGISPSGYPNPSSEHGEHLPKNLALPVRCVK